MKKFLKRLLLIAFAILLFLYLLGSCVGSSDDDDPPKEDTNAPQSESISQPEMPPTAADEGDPEKSELPPAEHVPAEEETPQAPTGEEAPQAPAAEKVPETAPDVSPEETVPAVSDSAILPNTARFLGKKGSTNGPDSCRRTTASKLDYATFSVAEEELLTLLQGSRYQLSLTGSEVIADDESFHDWAYYFVYTGSNGAVQLLAKNGETFPYHVKLLFEHYRQVDEVNISLYYCDAFTLEETGQTSSAVSSGSSGEKDCWYCGGSGKCPTCHGSGTVRNWVPGTTDYMEQSCTDCYAPGKCRMCGGSGRE